jgi:triose/dihydroxyacetone kinase / FAD-AMP lyase (cyclizing)
LTNPTIAFDEANKIVYRHPASLQNPSNVSLICGGGSGHEPAWVGYVGKGLLTACVAGTIFASPGAEQVRACVAHRLPKESKGLLVIVMNYTGDVLNFGMGAEKARAMGQDVEMVVIGDDVGVGREKGGKVGRRGIAGGAFVVKICGALAEAGASLADVARIGRLTGDNLVSVASSLSRVHVIGKPTSDADEEHERMPYGRVELGMGIHNEPGCEQLETNLPDLVKKMLSQLLDQNDKDRAYVKIDKSDQVLMLINNFGGLSNLELGAITNEVWNQLNIDWGIQPIRVYTGVFNGSLNGLGFGVSLLRLADTGLGSGKSLLELVDAPAEGVGWPAPINIESWNKSYPAVEEKELQDEAPSPSNLKGKNILLVDRLLTSIVNPTRFTQTLTRGLQRVIAAEPQITKYDSIVGDGDCGTGLRRGAEAILSLLSSQSVSDDLLLVLSTVVRVAETTMDGTSGAIYAIFLNSLVHNLRMQDSSTSVQVNAKIWASALQKSLRNLEQYTPAKPGDRTLVDALEPFVETLVKTGDLAKSAKAATEGSESTKGMKPGLGRSVYVGGTGWQDVPDPGAYGLSEFLEGLAEGF